MDSQTKKANFSLALAKVFSGVNMNGLKYLLPLWMSAITGVTARCLFGAIAFWLVSLFIEKDQLNWKQRIVLFFSGAIILYSALICFLLGLSLTTPISGAIFCSLQPIFVFIISLLVFHEKFTVMKRICILLGIGGAIPCVTTHKRGALAYNVLVGNVLCVVCA